MKNVLLGLSFAVVAVGCANKEVADTQASTAPVATLREPASMRIACWDLFAKQGSRPFITAQALDGMTLAQFQFDRSEDQAGYLPAQFAGPLRGQLNDSNHSPYKGTNNYIFEPGLRLITPAILDANLASAHIVGGQRDDSRQNAILVISNNVYNRSSNNGSVGDISVRMHCISQ